MSKGTNKSSAGKPGKPHKDFPLFPHSAGVWAKKIRGKTHYFGPWHSPDEALAKYLDQKDALLAGRTPRPKGDDFTVMEMLNSFLTQKENLRDSGEILPRTFKEYNGTTDRIAAAFGLNRPVDDLAADDFATFRAEMSKQWGPVRLRNEMTRVEMVFKFAYESGDLDRPVRYGPAWKKPSVKALRQAKAKRGSRLFSPSELRTTLKAASPNLKAMILLGVNAGFGNTDVATLPVAALDLKRGWVDYPRPKTGITRRCPLWEETTDAIKAALKARPEPKDEADRDLVFLTSGGLSYGGEFAHRRIAADMKTLLKKAKVYRDGLSFYSLRHSFQTVGDQSKNYLGVRAIMGHAARADDMGSIYREEVSDEDLRAVTDFVRNWLFPRPSTEGGAK